MDLTVVIDCTGANLAAVDPPHGALIAGYTTGSGPVPWTPQQFAQHPGAVRIDQSPVNTAADETADVLDVERGAATIGDIPGWVRAAQANVIAGTRPGQRRPAVYLNRSELTPAANALNAAGITGGVAFWVAAPMNEQEAAAMVATASGPFPVIGVQYAFQSLFDVSVVSTAWLNAVSKAPENSQPGPGTQTGFKFCHKCQGLFWGPGEAISVCPRGAQHDGTGSHVYTLGFER